MSRLMSKVYKGINRLYTDIMLYEKDEKASISIEIVLLLVVFITLLAAFKSGITTTLTSILSKISDNAGKI